MQEFSSVTASSYAADSLASLLTEKSAEGWSVVSIVSAGSNIVAYLERESDGSTSTADGADAAASTDTTTDDAASAAGGVVPAAAAAAAIPATDTPAAEVAATEVAAVDEPAGWANAPDSATDAAGDSPDDSLADLVADVEAADTANAAPALADTAAEAPATESPAEQPAAEQPAAEQAAAAPAAESTVPAGWYADPSGRFELRYWDGSAWTEHVSRAGQQFTDPPVA